MLLAGREHMWRDPDKETPFLALSFLAGFEKRKKKKKRQWCATIWHVYEQGFI